MPAAIPVAAPAVVPATVPAAPADIGSMDWATLQASAATCQACALCRSRRHVVFGDGDERAQWLFVTTAPSRDDDAAGLPLAGPRGHLMDNMLRAAGLNRIAGTFLTPAVKCLPLDADGRERPPTAAEMAACRPYLERQIALLAPDVIIAMGQPHPLLAADAVRGQVYRHGAARLITMADPQTLLEHAAAKADAWADLCLAKASHAAPD